MRDNTLRYEDPDENAISVRVKSFMDTPLYSGAMIGIMFVQMIAENMLEEGIRRSGKRIVKSATKGAVGTAIRRASAAVATRGSVSTAVKGASKAVSKSAKFIPGAGSLITVLDSTMQIMVLVSNWDKSLVHRYGHTYTGLKWDTIGSLALATLNFFAGWVEIAKWASDNAKFFDAIENFNPGNLTTQNTFESMDAYMKEYNNFDTALFKSADYSKRPVTEFGRWSPAVFQNNSTYEREGPKVGNTVIRAEAPFTPNQGPTQFTLIEDLIKGNISLTLSERAFFYIEVGGTLNHNGAVVGTIKSLNKSASGGVTVTLEEGSKVERVEKDQTLEYTEPAQNKSISLDDFPHYEGGKTIEDVREGLRMSYIVQNVMREGINLVHSVGDPIMFLGIGDTKILQFPALSNVNVVETKGDNGTLLSFVESETTDNVNYNQRISLKYRYAPSVVEPNIKRTYIDPVRRRVVCTNVDVKPKTATYTIEMDTSSNCSPVAVITQKSTTDNKAYLTAVGDLQKGDRISAYSENPSVLDAMYTVEQDDANKFYIDLDEPSNAMRSLTSYSKYLVDDKNNTSISEGEFNGRVTIKPTSSEKNPPETTGIFNNINGQLRQGWVNPVVGDYMRLRRRENH